MSNTFVCQGRVVSEDELIWLRKWIEAHGEWSRFRLAKELCKLWNWTTPTGQLKDFAARTYLHKLMQRGLIVLPAVNVSMQRKRGFAVSTSHVPDIAPPTTPINTSLSELYPLELIIPESGTLEERHFHHYLSTHHYLGFHGTVGENMKYLVRDKYGRDVACMLFGAAAWKVRARDQFIGWSPEVRAKHLSLITNNTRFLILPWVRVAHVASHILGRILRRIRDDWELKYGHPVWIVETFVERERFKGTCYKAANWQYVGTTCGRSRQDRYSTLSVPIKDIYIYPLKRGYRDELCNENR
jgi:hypothetical protein